MDEAEIERTLERIRPEIDRLVRQSLERLDAATGSVAVRKVLHARFVQHAIEIAQDRFPCNLALACVLGTTPANPAGCCSMAEQKPPPEQERTSREP